MSETIDDLFHNLDEYSQHLEALHELETYYGDETLENLIRHSKNVVGEIQKFKDIYSLEEETEEDEDEEDAEEEE